VSLQDCTFNDDLVARVPARKAAPSFPRVVVRRNGAAPKITPCVLHPPPAAPPVPHFPRFRALALFGRRSSERVDSFVMPASENLHRNGHLPRFAPDLKFLCRFPGLFTSPGPTCD
jgi:hypothetical protein